MSRNNVILVVSGAVIFVILVIVFAIMLYSMQNKDTTIMEMEGEIDSLHTQIEMFGGVVEIYTVDTPKKAGTLFRPEDVRTMVIPGSQVNDQYVTDLSILSNGIYKINVEPGTPLMHSLFYKEALTHTDRYYDAVADVFPVGAEIGDFYDMRIVTPNGLDYILLSKKRVVDFFGQAVRFIMTEEEIHHYQSALVDAFLNPGTYLYMSTYVEPGLQKKAETYYPVSDLVLAVMEIDPNITQIAEEDLVNRRRIAFERGLRIGDLEQGDITTGRTELITRLTQSARERLQAKALEEQQAEAAGEGAPAEEPPSGNLISAEPTGGTQEPPFTGEDVNAGLTGGEW